MSGLCETTMSDSRLPSPVWKTKIEFLVASGNVIIVPENKDFLYVFLLFSLDILDSTFYTIHLS